VLQVRRTGGLLNVAAAAGARINQLAGLKLTQSRFVQREPLGLHDRTFIPVQPEPTQVCAGLFGGSRFHAR